MELLVTDAAGRRVGRMSSNDQGFAEVPGATYDRYLDMKNVALNAPGRYTVGLTGTDEGDATIRVRLGRITSLQRVAVSDPQTDSSGLMSAIVTYRAAVTSSTGAATAQTYDAHFVQQFDGWKLWYTTTR